MKKELLTLFCVAGISFPALGGTYNIAPKARATASSSLNADGDASKVNDGYIRLDNAGEWVSAAQMPYWQQLPYPWIRLDWDEEVTLSRIVLYDRPTGDAHTAGGDLFFSDGTRIGVVGIPDNGEPKVVEFAPKRVRWVKFEVNDAVGSHVGLSEIEAFPPAEAGGDFVSQVDPFIETTKGRYFFFITGNQPFGMIGAAPLTRNRNQYGGGYNYNSTEVLGFPQIHNWVLAGLTLMPTTGNVDPTLGEGQWKSHFRHEGEIAQPGYHRLFLEDYGIWVEQTATDRTGFYRLTFTRDAEAGILLNLGGYLASTTMCNARVQRVGEHEIEGSFDTYGRHWGGPENVRVYFVVRFDRPFDRLDGWVGTRRYSGIDSLEGSSEITRRHPREALSYLDSPTSGVAAHYGVRTGDRIHVRTAVSYVSTENARENLTHDATTWDFDAVRRAAQDEWNEWLGRIEVKGGTQQQRTKFYTDLWHVLLGRHKIDDVNGEYPDLTDGQRAGSFTRDIRVKTRTLPRDAAGRVVHHMYNSDAFWLTQWNLNVLWGLGWPEMPDEMSASLIRYADNGGLIPRGPCAGGYTYIMSGCPATPLIVSAYNKGLMRKCDPMHAFRTMQRNHMPGGMQGIGEFYLEHGYQPKNAGMTIESNFQDWALAQMAVRVGLEDEAAYFGNRSHGWRKLYRPDQQLLFPKDEQGQWLHDDPLRGTGWIEANAWQATWGVSHELPTLATLMGGYDKFCEKLNYAFEQAAPQDFVFGYGQGYVSYANQPGCSNAHVFSWGGKPWLTQYWVRRVNEQAYGGTTPDRGYGGHDEDQGQMGGVSALPRIRDHLAGLRRGVDPSRQAILPGRPFRPVRHPHLRQFGQELLYPTRTPKRPGAQQLLVPSRRIRTRRPARAMAGAQAQHSLGNRETPRIAAGIFPIGGASGQRMRRYFFGASPPGEGREQREKAGSNKKRQEQQEGAGNNAGAAMPEMPDNAARHANRQAGATCRTDDRRRAAHSRKQAADGQQSAGQAAASRLKEDFMYIQTATIGRRSSGTATAPGRGNQGTIRNRLRPVPAKNMQANRYYPQRYRESTGKGIFGGR